MKEMEKNRFLTPKFSVNFKPLLEEFEKLNLNIKPLDT